MTVIVSTIKSLDGVGDTVEAIIREYMPTIQQQPGCEVYALHRVRGRRHRGMFILLEKWVDDAAMVRYGKSPELIELHERLENLIESLEDFLLVDGLDIGDPVKGVLGGTAPA